MQGRNFAGTSWDCLTPFSVLTGVALMFGYGLLGAGWLVLKTEGELQSWARRAGRICLIGVLAAIVIVSVWTPLADTMIAQRWFAWPNIVLLAPVPLLTVVMAFAAWRALDGWGGDGSVFATGFGLFILSYLGIAVSLWPMIVPRHYTIWQAASAEGTQVFLLIGTLFLLPIIVMYTGWSYWCSAERYEAMPATIRVPSPCRLLHRDHDGISAEAEHQTFALGLQVQYDPGLVL